MAQQAPQQTPEGRLIEDAVKASGRSVRQLAANAGMSDTRWRQIIRGHQPDPRGQGSIQVKAPPLTLARMAKAAGVTAAALREVGRGDAALILPTLEEEAGQGGGAVRARGPLNDQIAMIYASTTMTAQQKLEAIRMVLELQEQAAKEAPPVKGGASVQQRESANNGT